jgi:hypothetical protein
MARRCERVGGGRRERGRCLRWLRELLVGRCPDGGDHGDQRGRRDRGRRDQLFPRAVPASLLRRASSCSTTSACRPSAVGPLIGRSRSPHRLARVDDVGGVE